MVELTSKGNRVDDLKLIGKLVKWGFEKDKDTFSKKVLESFTPKSIEYFKKLICEEIASNGIVIDTIHEGEKSCLEIEMGVEEISKGKYREFLLVYHSGNDFYQNYDIPSLGELEDVLDCCVSPTRVFDDMYDVQEYDPCDPIELPSHLKVKPDSEEYHDHMRIHLYNHLVWIREKYPENYDLEGEQDLERACETDFLWDRVMSMVPSRFNIVESFS